MAKFKVGDRVKCVAGQDGRGEGLTGIVCELWPTNAYVGVEFPDPFDGHGENGRQWNFFDADNQLVLTPKFAVGDRVRVLIDDACGDYKKGDVVTVVKGDDDGVYFYDDDDDKRYLSFDCVEPVAVAQQPQLTIRAGRYYKTRDGRKVGPMKKECNEPHPWIEEFGDGRLWRHDGTGVHEADGEDLIAEWVDEPAVAEPKFKVGDRVKFVDGYGGPARGKEATVVKLNVWGEGKGIQVDQGGRWGISTEHAHSLRLVAPATSGKQDGDWDAELREIEEEERAPTTIADIVRRLEALEADKPKPIKKGDLVVFNRAALVTGLNVDGRTVSVQTDGGNYSLPLAALRAA